MPTPYEIPLIPQGQTFKITLAGIVYQLTVQWNVQAGAWVLDIADSTGTSKIVSGIPLVTGTDLLAPFAYLNFGGKLYVQTDHNLDAIPTFDNLGSSSHLYFVTP